jgi:hypothetical protein
VSLSENPINPGYGWHVEHDTTQPGSVLIKDAAGTVVAWVRYPADAYLIIAAVQALDRLDEDRGSRGEGRGGV